MSIEELKKAIEEMKAQGQSEEEIAGAFYLLFRDEKITLEQLEALVNVLGFELSDEFKAMDPEMQKDGGYEVLDEEASEQGENTEYEEETPEETSDDEEEDEEEQAMKLLGQGKKKENQEKTSKPEEKEEKEDEEEEDEEKKAMKFFN